MPPSAMTVCALPSSDLQITAVRTPSADASIAARNPAPPAPMTSTSCSMTGWFIAPLKNSPLVPNSDRQHAHVEIGEADPNQADPCPLHVLAIQAADTAVCGR